MASARRDAFAACALALLSVVSVGRSAPVACEELLHPLEWPDPGHYQGPWALVAGSLSDAPAMEALRLRDSITMYFSNASAGASTISYTQVNRFGDECRPLHYNVSVRESAFSFDVRGRFELTGSFVRTSCPDCAVMKWHVRSSKRISTDVYLLSRRREVGPREMEEFGMQLRCHGLPAAVVMDPSKELCPGPLQRGATAAPPQTTAAETTATEQTTTESTATELEPQQWWTLFE